MRKSSPESGGCHPRVWVWFWVVGGAEAGLLTWHDERVTVEMQKKRESTFPAQS